MKLVKSFCFVFLSAYWISSVHFPNFYFIFIFKTSTSTMAFHCWQIRSTHKLWVGSAKQAFLQNLLKKVSKVFYISFGWKNYLKNRVKTVSERVKIGPRPNDKKCLFGIFSFLKFSSENLGSQKSKNGEEETEEDKKGHNRLDRVDQWT